MSREGAIVEAVRQATVEYRDALVEIIKKRELTGGEVLLIWSTLSHYAPKLLEQMESAAS